MVWAQKCRLPARVAHQGSASLLCCCLKNRATQPDRWDGEGALGSNRPGGLVILVRRAAKLPLPKEGSSLLILVARRERLQRWVRGMPASVRMTTS